MNTTNYTIKVKDESVIEEQQVLSQIKCNDIHTMYYTMSKYKDTIIDIVKNHCNGDVSNIFDNTLKDMLLILEP